jgi:outer membrane protein insertion porin family
MIKTLKKISAFLIPFLFITFPLLTQKVYPQQIKDVERENNQETEKVSEGSDRETWQIYEVKITGAERVSEEYIRSVILSKEGKKLDPITLRQDIERIFKLDFFDDVKAEFKDGILTFYLKEKPIISEIQVEGRKELEEEKFKEIMKLKQGDFFDERKLKSQIDSIISEYRKQGFIFTRIESKIEQLPQNRVKLKLKIEEGKKFLVRKILFSGAKKLSEDELKKCIQTKETNPLKKIVREGKVDINTVNLDKENTKICYLDWGFLDAEIKSPPALIIDPAKEETLVLFRVANEGERYKVKRLNLAGDIIFDKEQIIHNLKTKENEFVSRKKVLEDIEWITSLYQDVGFGQARVDPLISKEKNLVDIDFQISRGDISYIKNINIKGNTRTRDFVIRRNISLLEGEAFSRTALVKSYFSLMRTGFFEKVDINPIFLEDNRVDLDIEVKEGRMGAISLGGGFSPQFGNFFQSLFLMFQGQLANFRGMGQNLGFYLALGGGFAFFNFYFQDDHAFDTDYIMGINLFRYQSFFLPFRKISTGGKFNTGFFLEEKTKFVLSPGIEIVDVYDRRTGLRIPLYQDDPGAGFGRSDLRFLRAEIRNDTRDNPLAPSRGRLITLWSKVGGVFGGDLYYVKFGISNTFFIPIKWGIVFSPALRLGGGFGLTASRFLPYPERFFAGGIYSMRGYEYFSLGRKEQVPGIGEIVLGGNKSVISNLELIFPVVRQAGLFFVLFSDIGQVFAEQEKIDILNFRASYGFEIRWISPFGPIRFSIGFPLVKKRGDQFRVFDFSLGLFQFYPELEEF